MAQTWESQAVQDQGKAYAAALEKLTAAKKAKDTQAEAAARAAMNAAHNSAQQLRADQGYTANASGLNATTIQQPQVQQVPQAQPPQVSISNMIDQQAQQQQAAQAAAIQDARNKLVSDYNSQISATPQTYQPLKNQASYAGAKNLMAVKEQMAAQGLQNSGDNVSANIQVNTATANDINGLNLQEQNVVNQLKKAISDANASADMQTLQSNAEINAQKLQALISQANADRDYDLTKASTNANIANTQANTAYQNKVNSSYDTELAAKLAQAAAELKATNLANEAQTVANKYAPQIAQGQIDEQKLKSKYQELVNSNYDKQVAADLAVAYANVRQSNASAAATLRNARTNEAELAWRKDPSNPANQKVDSSTTNTVDDYSAAINRLYIQSPNANNEYKASQDTAGIKAYIDSLIAAGVSDTIIDQLAARYGIR